MRAAPSPQYPPETPASDGYEEEKEDVKKDVRKEVGRNDAQTPMGGRSKAPEGWFDPRNFLRMVAADDQARQAAGAPVVPPPRGGLEGSLRGSLNHTWYDGQFLVAARSADEADRQAYREALHHQWFNHSTLVAARARDIEDRKAYLAVQASGSPADRRAFVAAQDDTQAMEELLDKRKKARKEMEARRKLLQPRDSPLQPRDSPLQPRASPIYTAPPRSPSGGMEMGRTSSPGPGAPQPRYTAPPHTPGAPPPRYTAPPHTPRTGGRMASKTLMLLSLCAVVSPTDAVDDQSLLPPPPPARPRSRCSRLRLEMPSRGAGRTHRGGMES
jgi:hypothetical protein